MNRKQILSLLSGPAVFFGLLFIGKPETLSQEGYLVLASTAWIALWWIFEAIPISVTALIPIILFPLTGAVSLADTTAAFGHKYIFLYLGGFMIAIGIERWNLHRRIALQIINLIGTNLVNIILGFMIATAFLSMWISNTATAVMMLPIGTALISQLKAQSEDEHDVNYFGKALMLSIAYSASIGGFATLIGTPPNLVLAGVIEETFNTRISFSQWMSIGFPISVVLLFTAWLYITRRAFKFHSAEFPGGRQKIKSMLDELGEIKYEEKMVMIVFVATAIAWMGRALIQKIIPAIDDTIIAMIAGISLFIIPNKGSNRKLITWEEAVKLPWGVLLLFGGGMALAKGFGSTGLAAWIAIQLGEMQGLNLILLILLLVLAVNFLTEVTSNLATTAMLLPVLAPMAQAFGLNPYMIMVPVTIAASCAFMLPVATPPNAVVFGSGYLRVPDMLRVGFSLNLISALLITIAIYYLLPLIWGFDAMVFPDSL